MSGNHWWWTVPEFVQAQRDPRFRAWVESIELGMELGEERFEEIIPGLSIQDPFSDEGINLAEAVFLQTFADRVSFDGRRDLMMRFAKYLGQAYVAKLECRWVWQPIVEGRWSLASPAIEFPWATDMLLPIVPLLNNSVRTRRGNKWLFVFDNSRARYRSWVEEGRPGFSEWKAHVTLIG